MNLPKAVTVHALGIGDQRMLRAMLSMFGHAFDDLDRYTTAQPSDDYLHGLLSSSAFICVAALVDGQVVGGLAAYVLPKFEQARSEIYIYDLAVEVAHRRRRIATELINELRRLAAQRGAYVIFVQADPEDAPAVALYTTLGLREDVCHFDIEPAARTED